MRRLFVMMLMIFAVVCYSKLFAQKPAVVATNEPGWHHIGHTTASFKSQNESIVVLGADEFSSLKVKVSDASIHIDRMQVFYESGEMEDVDVKGNSGKGSIVVSLKHPDRDIKKVAFTYNTVANAKGEKAEIDLYGLKTNQPAGTDSYRDEKKELNEETEEAKREMKEHARDAENKTEEQAEKAGNTIEEGAKDAAAAITDTKLKYQVGPGGETAYVDDSGRYYYINNSGEKVFISKSQLRDKPNRDIDNDRDEVKRKDGDAIDRVEEGAKDAAAAIADKKVKDKVGPGGETAYLDDDGRYYIINNSGEKVFISKSQLKDKDHE